MKTNHSSRDLAAPIKMNESEIVDAFRAGSERALEQIVAKYRSLIYSVALRFTGNHHDADEVVQQTFWRAFRSAPRFRGDASLATWLYTIAANLARNRYRYWRRRKEHEVISLDAPADRNGEKRVREVIAIEDVDVGSQIEQNEFARQVQKGIKRLPHRDRIILKLRGEQLVPYKEIARRLTIPIGTVKSRIARARSRLCAEIRTEWEAEAAIVPKNLRTLHQALPPISSNMKTATVHRAP